MRLIDAEYLLYGMGVFSEKENGTEFMKGVDAVAKMIDDAPTIASLPVWTPCAEGLPRSETDNVLVCFLDKYGFMEVAIGWYWIPSGKWYTDEKQNSVDVLAWQPLPEPYNPDRKEDAKSDDVSQWPEWKQRAALSNYDFKKEDSE